MLDRRRGKLLCATATSALPASRTSTQGLARDRGVRLDPVTRSARSALAIESHFFEFIERHEQHSIQSIGLRETLFAHELTLGNRYEVIVTTGGGLYRYQMHDEIEVVGFEHECPLIRFVGKTDLTSDLVGEKLGSSHVEQALGALCREFDCQPTFMMLAPLCRTGSVARLLPAVLAT